MFELTKEVVSVCKQTKDKISLLSNLSALIKENMNETNWVGFYLYKNGELHLGPFQGKVACTTIPIGQGVCGTSFDKKMLLNVGNVHDFPGHIACDNASNSEIVVPLIYEGKRIGVLDIDSPIFNRFTSLDENVLEEICKVISKALLA